MKKVHRDKSKKGAFKMFNIKNLTHNTLKISEDVSIAPHSTIEFKDAVTSEITRFERMGLLSISSVKAAQTKSATQPLDVKSYVEDLKSTALKSKKSTKKS